MATKPQAATHEKAPTALGRAAANALGARARGWLERSRLRGARLGLISALTAWQAILWRVSPLALALLLLGCVAIVAWEVFGERSVARSFRRLPRRHSVLSALLPSHATRVRGEQEQRVPIAELAAGDIVRVRPREALPVDGVIVDGRSAVDEQRLTGEPLPLDKRVGSHVLGGSRNGRGMLLVRAERSADHGVLAGILARLDSAEHSRASSVRAATQLGAWLAGWSVLASMLALALGALLAPTQAPGLALAVLVTTGPGLYVRTLELAVARATARGAFLGVLARSADALEALARCDALVVDKTDTLTEPRARIVSVVAAEGSEAELVADAARLVRHSDHPLAAAVVMRARTLGLAFDGVERVVQVPGEGCYGNHGDSQIALGSSLLLARLGASDVTLEGKAEALREHGQSVLFCLRDGRVVGLIGLTFPIKLTTRDALRELDEAGVRVVIASGDGTGTLDQLRTQLEIREAHGDLAPQGKRELVQTLTRRGLRVCVATRDAALADALAAADVGIALGGDGELERGADLQLFPDDLSAIARAFTLALELEASVRRQKLAILGAQLGLPAASLVLAASVFAPIVPLCALGASLALNAGLLVSAALVARVRRERAEWASHR